MGVIGLKQFRIECRKWSGIALDFPNYALWLVMKTGVIPSTN